MSKPDLTPTSHRRQNQKHRYFLAKILLLSFRGYLLSISVLIAIYMSDNDESVEFSKSPFANNFNTNTPDFWKGNLVRWFNNLTEEEKAKASFVIEPNPRYLTIRKLIDFIEEFGIISYAIAQDMRLIPNDMKSGTFFNILHYEIPILLTEVQNRKCNSRVYHKVASKGWVIQ